MIIKRKFAAMIAFISISAAAPAYCAQECPGVEPICDYPLEAVCAQQQGNYYGRTGQLQAAWICREKEQSAKVAAKENIQDRGANSKLNFFPDGFVDRTTAALKNNDQRSSELFGN